MKWWDYLLIFVSFLCTIFSIIGAHKSNAYYKKSKSISIYANMNSSYIESQTIIATLTEMLKLGSKKRKKGVNYLNEVNRKGEIIKNSIIKIRENLPVEDCNEINKLLNEQELKVELYIDSFITGAVLVDEQLFIDDDFNKCQQVFCDIQMLLKEKLENVAEKLK